MAKTSYVQFWVFIGLSVSAWLLIHVTSPAFPGLFMAIFVGVGMFVFLWFRAPRIYEAHRRMKEQNPASLDLWGEKHLDDPRRWIKRFRIYLVLVAVFFTIVLVWLLEASPFSWHA